MINLFFLLFILLSINSYADFNTGDVFSKRTSFSDGTSQCAPGIVYFPSGSLTCSASGATVTTGGGASGSFIKTDGTSTTTASIPFAQGLNSSGAVNITAFIPSFTFGDLSGDSLSWTAAGGQITQTFNNGAVDPDTLTWNSTVLSFSSTLQASQLKSTVATGSTPLIVASTTKVTNLNADLLDGINTGTTGNVIGTLNGINTYSGMSTFTSIPTGVTNSTSSVVINPASSSPTTNDLLWFGVNGTSVATVNAKGELLGRTLISNVANGTPPIVVQSSTNVANLNSSTLQGSSVGSSGATIPLLNGTNTFSGVQLFNDTDLTLRNPANTFTTVLSSGAITAGRTVTLPNATTTVPGLSQSNTFTGSTQTISTSAASLLNLTNTGTPMTFQWGLNSGILTLKDITNSFTFLTIDPVGVGDDLTFNGTNGTTFQFGGNASIAFQATTFFFTASDHSSNFRFDFGTAGQLDQYVGSTQVTRLKSTEFDVTGNVKLTTAGNGIYVKEGTNATMGTGTLSGGTVVISTTKVTASSRIFITDTGGGVLANIGVLYVSARSAGTSFTVSSANALDSSTFNWIIIEPS